jgi:hypothetical protein
MGSRTIQENTDFDKGDKKIKGRTRDEGQRSTVFENPREGFQSPTKALVSGSG